METVQRRRRGHGDARRRRLRHRHHRPGGSGADGLAIAAEARRLHAETQVIIITGQGSKDTILQALRQGVSDYLEKPFDLELLLLTVEKALEKTLVLRELIQLARTDGLTGLYNQRHFYSVLEAEINRARRQNRALSLLLVDVDDFKRYNDRFGHLAGDAALARIAACLKKACRRDIDTAFRYGGDEFILVLPEADRATAEGIAARVRSLLVDEGIALTVSIGVAELREGQDLKAFIREADQAMYRDKGGEAPARCHHGYAVALARPSAGGPCLPSGYSLQSRPCPRTTTSRTRIPSRRRSRASGAPRSGARSISPRSRR